MQQAAARHHSEPAAAATVNKRFADPFGVSFGGKSNASALDPYGMGLMGGSAQNQGDYANPFAL